MSREGKGDEHPEVRATDQGIPHRHPHRQRVRATCRTVRGEAPLPTTLPCHDETGLFRVEPHGEERGRKKRENIQLTTLPTFQKCRKIYIATPGHNEQLDYSNYDARIASFTDWPRSMAQTPTAMADAGLYYLGIGDKVECFSCKGLLDNWTARDEPWQQHAYWFRDCEYVVARKGTDYVQKTSLQPPIDASLADTMACYRSYCQKTIRPTEVERMPIPENEKAALMECIPAGFIAPGTRLDDVVFDNLCRYCGLRRVSGIYAPCSHTVACHQCALASNKCDICNEEILFVKKIVIIPDRPYNEYEQLVSPMMIQEANDLTSATIRTLQALGRK